VSAPLVLSLLILAAARQSAPAAAAQTPAAPPVAIHWEGNFADALRKAKRSSKPVIVDFWADWCGWCERLNETTYADPTVVRKAQDFVAVKVNAEGSHKETDVARRYQVSSLPTILFLSPDGRQLGRIDGYQGPGHFPHTLDAVLAVAKRVMSWEEALARNPDDPRALAALGAHLYEQMVLDEARLLLKKAVGRDSEEPADDRRRTRMVLAILESASRNFAEAEKLVKDALSLEPNGEDEPKLLFVLGRTYVSWGRQDEGVATMEIIVRQYPQSPLAQKARETLSGLRGR
jgi:thioredoxin-like negative regulator of GroEL